jgi:general secretion pathway protein D
MRNRGLAAVAVALALGSTVALPSRALAAVPTRAAERARSGGGSTCTKLPEGKRIVKLNLKPETEVADLVAWISSVTCRQFVLPDVPASHAKVTIVAPSLITSGEAYRLFLDALDSVGLTVYPSGPFFRIIETGKAKTYPVPVIGFDGPR